MSQWLAERAVWEGRAFVQGRLYQVDWYPGLVPGKGLVSGDIYRIPQALLTELDTFESIRHQPDDEYRRELADVESFDGKTVRAWIYWYVLPVMHLQEVASGDWLQYLQQ